MPQDKRLNWKLDSALYDGGAEGIDLTGGYYVGKSCGCSDVRPAMSNTRPSRRICVTQFSFSLQYPHFDNLGIDIIDAGGPQCHIITSVLRAGRYPYVH